MQSAVAASENGKSAGEQRRTLNFHGQSPRWRPDYQQLLSPSVPRTLPRGFSSSKRKRYRIMQRGAADVKRRPDNNYLSNKRGALGYQRAKTRTGSAMHSDCVFFIRLCAGARHVTLKVINSGDFRSSIQTRSVSCFLLKYFERAPLAIS